MLIDTHTHLSFPQYNDTGLPDILNRAKQAGVEYLINVGSDIKTSQDSIVLAQKYSNIYATVGIHPHDAEPGENQLPELEKLIKQPKVVAIGEAGLDYFKNLSPQDKQKKIFCAQLDLANKYNLPIIIHAREADDDTYELLKNYKPAKAVMHCFAGDIAYARKILDLGYYISFTGNITFAKNIRGQETAAYVPLDRIMLETDCPFLSPEPHRGRTNEPAYVKFVVEKIAQLKKITSAEVAEVTTKNALSFFAIA